jgi:hypothetical protein
MVGSDHDLDYPPYLHRQPAAEAAASRRTKMNERLQIVIWTLALAVAAVIVIVMVAM